MQENLYSMGTMEYWDETTELVITFYWKIDLRAQ